MKASRFDSLLRASVGSQWITADTRDEGTILALLEYSRWRPTQRRFGEGVLAFDTPAGATSLYLTGMPPAAGQSIRIDAAGLNQEDATVADVEYADESSELSQSQRALAPFTLVQVTLSAPLSTKKRAGCLVVPLSSGQEAVGLALKASTSRYLLPSDFAQPDQGSLDVALGIRAEHRAITFYDGVYRMSMRLSGTGAGYRQDYLPLPLSPARRRLEGESFPTLDTASGSTWTFFLDGEPRRLELSVPPTEGARLDFHYQALHTVATVAEADGDVLVALAVHFALGIEAQKLSQQLNFSEAGVTENWRSTISSMNEQIERNWAFAMDRLRNVPFCTTG